MKKNVITLGILMGSVFMASGAMADNSASVDLSFKGSIQETTCEINADETQKDIDFGMLPASVGKGESATQNIILSFKGCPVESAPEGYAAASKVSVTLTGEEGLPDSLKVTPAEGAALKDTDLGIQLFDKDGKIVKIGVPAPLGETSGDTLKVMLNAKVKGNGTTEAGKGAFTAKAVLNVAYL